MFGEGGQPGPGLVVGLGAQVERLSERRQFGLDDLPLSVPNSTRASQEAQDCYSQLQNNPELRASAIAWINLNLDAAIASLRPSISLSETCPTISNIP